MSYHICHHNTRINKQEKKKKMCLGGSPDMDDQSVANQSQAYMTLQLTGNSLSSEKSSVSLAQKSIDTDDQKQQIFFWQAKKDDA